MEIKMPTSLPARVMFVGIKIACAFPPKHFFKMFVNPCMVSKLHRIWL